MFEDLTVLVAHPDDELLFLWPFLCSTAGVKPQRIVSVVSDGRNAERAMPHRAEALRQVGRKLDISVECLNAESDFFRINPRHGDLRCFLDSTFADLKLDGPLATHNPWGEYGHLDHILLHIAARGTARPVYCTDIVSEDPGRWFNVYEWVPGKFLMDAELDREKFEACRGIYQELGCWTWSWEPQEKCRVYRCI